MKHSSQPGASQDPNHMHTRVGFNSGVGVGVAFNSNSNSGVGVGVETSGVGVGVGVETPELNPTLCCITFILGSFESS